MNAIRKHTLPRSVCSAALIPAACLSAAAQVHVAPDGYFNPDGYWMRAFQQPAEAICYASPMEDVILAPATYVGRFVARGSTTLRRGAGPGNLILRGRTTASTTVRVVSYNTHLFGGALAGAETWLDYQRSAYIADAVRLENADFVGLQEIWDPFMASVMAPQTQYAHTFYGEAIGSFDVLNSGLMMLSPHELQQASFDAYDVESGEDWFANKGYLHATIQKQGFSIGVFNTHLQAGNGAGDQETRLAQMQELADVITLYRSYYTSRPVIVVGDFNVRGYTGEYSGAMTDAMYRRGGLLETAANQPCTGYANRCTACTDNALNQYFYDDVVDERLDYVLYIDSHDGTVLIRPQDYQIRRYEVPPGQPALSDDGLTTRTLSDHYGLYAEFEVMRP